MDRTPPPLPTGRFDLLVIGAGINGTGVARDAAMRGLNVVLVDKGDIASGTTSWSTRLIHGGLRYLEHREIGLVRESLRERTSLLRIASHLVHPLSFYIPVYDSDRRGPMMVRAGMLAYDALSPGDALGGYSMLSTGEALEREPGVEPEALKGAAVYHDAQAEYPERLAIENALSAHDHGAALRTHDAVERLLVRDGRVVGAALAGGQELHADVTVNVAGPWVDELLGPLWDERLIGGTKGSHLVVERFAGAPEEALYVEAEDGRPYFIVPWNDLFLIGTTDQRYEGDLDAVEASEEEVDYLIAETNRVIPEARLGRESIVYTYAGVRPLPYAEEGEEGSVPRGHVVKDHAPELEGLLSVIGGKLTTYRALAEDVVDAALAKIDRPKAFPCRTAEEPLPGAEAEDIEQFQQEFAEGSELPRPVADRLSHLYGTRATEVAERARAEPRLAEEIDSVTRMIGAEVVHALEAELATTLEDVLLRRTMTGLGQTLGIGPDVAAAALVWGEERAHAEVEAYRRRVERMRPAC